MAQQTTDLRGNVTEQKVFPNGAGQDALREQFAYDIGGNVTRYTDPKGQETAYRYDSVGRLSGVTLPNGETAAADYSAFNMPSFEKLYNADGAETLSRASYVNEKGDLSMQFYSFGKRLSRADSFAADAKGRMVSAETGGLPKAMAYDENDHLITETSGTSQILRRYDQNGEIIAASTDGSATEIRRAYSALGYPAQKRQDSTHNTYYTYSGTGRKTQQVTPSGRAEAYTYTPNGNLQSIATAGKMFSYAYYDNGLIQSVTYPNGLQTAYTYDAAGRVTAMETTGGGRTVNSLLYTYDANGNVLTETRNGTQTAYAYDSLDRLISVTYSDGSSVLYEYDALNNRTKETHSDGTVKEYTYNHAGQLSAVSVGGTVTDTYTYNAAGALSTHNGKTYTYDAWDRLSGYTDGTASYTYKYDTDGLRTQKNDTQYVVDIHNNVIAEANESGSVTAETVWGHRPLARKVGDDWYYYLYNAHGDVIGLTDESGTVVNSYAYSPWGEIRTQTEGVTNPIKYAGEYYDDELDMLYLRARYYDPQIGRFISLDAERGSIQNPMDMNRYVYCKNNPIKYVDPSGKNWIYSAWNWGEDAIWKSIAVAVSAVGWQLTADLLWLAASGSGNTFTATAGSYASNLAKNDAGINSMVNNIIWDYGTSQRKSYISTPKILYEIPLSNGDLGAALHWVSIQVNASRQNDGSWYANVTVTDTFDFTEFKNPFQQGSVVKGLLWLANDIAYFDTEWGLLDSVGVTIKYNNYY